MDNGMPFTTEPNTLLEMIPPSNFVKKFVTGITGSSNISGQVWLSPPPPPPP